MTKYLRTYLQQHCAVVVVVVVVVVVSVVIFVGFVSLVIALSSRRLHVRVKPCRDAYIYISSPPPPKKRPPTVVVVATLMRYTFCVTGYLPTLYLRN